MQAWMWRLTDHHAVIYTDDRATKDALLSYARFPHDDLDRATTYSRGSKRPFAWQFTFPLSLWNSVVRHLGRASVTFLDVEKPARTPAVVAETPAKARGNSGKRQAETKARFAAAPPPPKAARNGGKPTTPSGPLQPMVAASKNGKPATKSAAPAPTALPTAAATTANSRGGRTKSPALKSKPRVAASAQLPPPTSEPRPSGSGRTPSKGRTPIGTSTPEPQTPAGLRNARPSAAVEPPSSKSAPRQAAQRAAPAPAEAPTTTRRQRAAPSAPAALDPSPTAASRATDAPKPTCEAQPKKRATLAEKRPEMGPGHPHTPAPVPRRTAAAEQPNSPRSPNPRSSPKSEGKAPEAGKRKRPAKTGLEAHV